jgi:hypothetical protein
MELKLLYAIERILIKARQDYTFKRLTTLTGIQKSRLWRLANFKATPTIEEAERLLNIYNLRLTIE